jgi:hypothetical protein
MINFRRPMREHDQAARHCQAGPFGSQLPDASLNRFN